MSLPSVDRLATRDFAAFRALGERLRALGLSLESARPIADICKGMFNLLAAPLQLYHLRKRTDAVALAMRLFIHSDQVARAEAEGLLGAPLLADLLEVGLLVVAADDAAQLRCPFSMNLVGALFVFGDDLRAGDEAVMGTGGTTWDLCRAVASEHRLERVLDLGCGAGAIALLLAEQAREVVATDINPRALVLGRANAALNGIGNVTFREGDLFAPVAGEEFDLIVSQPPFIPRPAGVHAATYLYGGTRGDELPLRMLRETSRHLAPNGRAVVLIDWVRFDDEPLEARVRSALAAPELSLLVLATPEMNVDDWSAGHAAMQEQALGPEFSRLAQAFRAHFEAIAARALQLSFSVIVRGRHAPGWTRRVDILPLARTDVKASRIDALLASADALSGSEAELLATRIGLPAGAELVERAGRFRVYFADLLAPIEVNSGSAMLLAASNGAPRVSELLEQLAPKLGRLPESRARVLQGLREALSFGVLEVKS